MGLAARLAWANLSTAGKEGSIPADKRDANQSAKRAARKAEVMDLLIDIALLCLIAISPLLVGMLPYKGRHTTVHTRR